MNKRIATIICPGPSLNDLDSRRAAFIRDHTDTWGLNFVGTAKKETGDSDRGYSHKDVLSEYRIKLNFLHLEAINPKRSLNRSTRDEKAFSEHQKLGLEKSLVHDATLLCEQSCQWLGNMLPDGGYESKSGEGRLFKDYVSYRRQCITQECRSYTWGREPWAYRPREDEQIGVRVPMGNSFNRVLDLIVRMGYDAVVLAGCDNLSSKESVQDNKKKGADLPLSYVGKWVHPSHLYGKPYWGMSLDEYFVGFLRFNKVQFFSLTVNPLATDVRKEEFEIWGANDGRTKIGKPDMAAKRKGFTVTGYPLNGVKVKSLYQLRSELTRTEWQNGRWRSGHWQMESPYPYPLPRTSFVDKIVSKLKRDRVLEDRKDRNK